MGDVTKLPTASNGVAVYALHTTDSCPHFVVSAMVEGKWKELMHFPTLDHAYSWIGLRAVGTVMFDAEGNKV
jgi:hypothetical protein